MNTDFPRIISLLRKERNISQKKAAADLGVSQALLSHYEKGIRECGLDFIVKAADYYNVSCDYLLGRSPEPEGRIISCEPAGTGMKETENTALRSRKLFINSADLLISAAGKSGNPALMRSVSDYLMLAVYRMFRILYCSNPANDKRLFSVSEPAADCLADAAMSISRCAAMSSASDMPAMTTNSLSEEYPDSAPSLLSTVKESEKLMISLSAASKEEI